MTDAAVLVVSFSPIAIYRSISPLTDLSVAAIPVAPFATISVTLVFVSVVLTWSVISRWPC